MFDFHPKSRKIIPQTLEVDSHISGTVRPMLLIFCHVGANIVNFSVCSSNCTITAIPGQLSFETAQIYILLGPRTNLKLPKCEIIVRQAILVATS